MGPKAETWVGARLTWRAALAERAAALAALHIAERDGDAVALARALVRHQAARDAVQSARRSVRATDAEVAS